MALGPRIASPVGLSIQVPIPTLVTGFVQSFLQGIIFVQAGQYWDTAWDTDSRWLRSYVALVVFLSLLQTILEDFKVWRVAIFLKEWESSSWQWSEFFLNGLIVTVCSAYLIRRCWKVAQKKLWVLWSLGIFSVSLQIANIIMAVAVQKISHRLATGRSAMEQIRSSFIVFIYWSYGTLALNMILTAILIVFLWRSRIGIGHSDKVLWRISTITWESALLPAVSTLAAIGLYHADATKDNQLVVLFFVLTGKLYTVGLLRTLNTRIKLRERMKSHDLGRTSLGDWLWNQGTTTVGTRLDGMLPSTPGQQRSSMPYVTANSPGQRNCESTGFSPTGSRGTFVEDSHQISFASPHMDARERGIGIRKGGSNSGQEEESNVDV